MIGGPISPPRSRRSRTRNPPSGEGTATTGFGLSGQDRGLCVCAGLRGRDPRRACAMLQPASGPQGGCVCGQAKADCAPAVGEAQLTRLRPSRLLPYSA